MAADEPPVLLPCSICGRTFKPQSLEKHAVICERGVAKKRKPFDSAKQRIRGTELEEFLPKLTKKKVYQEEKRENSSWKQTHDEFIKTIRAARGDTEIHTTVNRQITTTAGAPTRANEKGLCPTCSRQFGIKAYDRHVAWCKERITRAPASPATNVAKERLEARIKYRAPALKNRRLTNREKYAPTSKKPFASGLKPQEVSSPHCNKLAENPSIKQPAATERRSGQGKVDGVIAPGPLKSRLSDRSANVHNPDQIALPLSPLYSTHTRNNQHSDEESTSLNLPSMSPKERCKLRRKGRNSRKIPKPNIASARTRGCPKVNDVTVNNDVVEMSVRPCTIHVDSDLITWKQISDGKKTKVNEAEISNEDVDVGSSSIDNLDQTYSIKELNEAAMIEKSPDAPTEILLSGNAEEFEPTSLGRFNLDITCASTPVSFKNNSNGEEATIMIDGFEYSTTCDDSEKCNSPIKKSAGILIDEITPLCSANFKSAHVSATPRNFTSDSLDSTYSSKILMRKRLKKKMGLLRNSTDSLISSIESSHEWRRPRIPVRTTILPVIKPDRETGREQHIMEEKHVPYWRQMMKNSKSRLINHLMKNPRVDILPPIVRTRQRGIQGLRPAWTNYVRRRPDFNLVLTGRTGACQEYDPFLLAERQLNDLLSDTCSDKSFPDSPSSHKATTPVYPLSSAFVKYPKPLCLDKVPEKRASLIAPPSEFDDMSTGFSSDSTETNSISRELFPQLESMCREDANKNKSQPILGRRVIIDKSKALGAANNALDINLNNKNVFAEKNTDKITPKVIRSQMTRSNSVRAASAPKIPDRKASCLSDKIISRSSPSSRLQSRSNNNGNLSGSNLSLSSIVSSEIEVKLPNSLFDDFASSFDEDSSSFPSLRSLLKNDSLSMSSPVQPSRTRNGQSDDDLSSPDSYKRQDQGKLSADSAYSSLNRKYSNDKTGRLNEDVPVHRRDNHFGSLTKLSKFCHECGTRFPKTAKFCCECGVQRLAL